MAAVVEAVPQMDATVSVLLVVGLERVQDAELDPGGVAILLDRSNDLDSHRLAPLDVASLDDFAKGSLAEETNNLV